MLSSIMHEICGHERQLLALRKIADKGMPIHAFIFSGPESVGKKTIAMHFLAGLFCEEKNGRDSKRFACLSCPSCVQVGEFRHPDFHFLSGHENEAIGIAEIRSLKERLSLRSWAGSWRGVLIDNAERLTPEAQSALLKILEEPSQGILFFLVTSEPHLLLDTIRSRAVPISFGTVRDEELAGWLSTYFPEINYEELMKFADGRPGEAKRFAQDRELFAAYQKKITKTDAIADGSLLDQFRFTDSLVEKGGDASGEFLGHLISITRDLLIKTPDSAGLIARMKTLLDLHFELARASANRRLLIDSAFIALKGLL